MTSVIPKYQAVGLSRAQDKGTKVEIVHDYPVPEINDREILAKVLYSGVCLTGN